MTMSRTAVRIVRSVWRAAQVNQMAREAMVRGLWDVTENVLEEANRMVPHDEGTLMRSGTADVDEHNVVGYVSYDTPYAARLHENPQYSFQKGREGKWLEKAVQNRHHVVERFLADAYRRGMRR